MWVEHFLLAPLNFFSLASLQRLRDRKGRYVLEVVLKPCSQVLEPDIMLRASHIYYVTQKSIVSPVSIQTDLTSNSNPGSATTKQKESTPNPGWRGGSPVLILQASMQTSPHLIPSFHDRHHIILCISLITQSVILFFYLFVVSTSKVLWGRY